MNYNLYVLQSEKREAYYIGSSDNPERCYFHNTGSKGYTLRYRPWKLVWSCEFCSKQNSLAAERKVKSWKSKKMTRYLVEGTIVIEDYL